MTGALIWAGAFCWAKPDGYVVADHDVAEMARVKTFALAKAWAGIRVNEQCVRH